MEKEKLNKDKYVDNSGDKKYFAMIPYYIVNHSSAYEQSLYLVMKRIASEEGTCYASPKTIGKTMKVSENTVKKYRDKLVKRGWIKKTGQRQSGRTGQLVNEYEIVDLWKLNIEYYNKVSNNDTLKNKVSNGDDKVSTVERKVSPVAYEEETIKNKPKEEIVSKDTTKSEYGNPDINNLINLLKEKFELKQLDGTIKENRRYCYLAIKKFKKEGVEFIIKVGSKDNFWQNKITGFKTLYYSGVKIASAIKDNKSKGIIVI